MNRIKCNNCNSESYYDSNTKIYCLRCYDKLKNMKLKKYNKDIKLNNMQLYLCYGYIYNKEKKPLMLFVNILRYENNKFNSITAFSLKENRTVTHYYEIPYFPKELEELMK